MLDLNLSKKSKKEPSEKKDEKKSIPIVRPFYLILLLVIVVGYFLYTYILPSFFEQKQNYDDLVPKVKIDSTKLKEALARKQKEAEKPTVTEPRKTEETKTAPPPENKPKPVRSEHRTQPAVRASAIYSSSIIGFTETIKNYLKAREFLLSRDSYKLISVTKDEIISEIATVSNNNIAAYRNLFNRTFKSKSVSEDTDTDNRYILSFRGSLSAVTTPFDKIQFARYYSSSVLIANLKEYAEQNNLIVEKIRERKSTIINGYRITPVVFKVSGNESDILNLLESIKNLNWNINVRKISGISRFAYGNLKGQLIIDFDVLSK